MAKTSFFSKRFKSATKALAKTEENLPSLATGFTVKPLSEKEEEDLRSILSDHSDEGNDIQSDFTQLASITSEVKAINNQAAILHGERIQKAQNILKEYHDGAFSSWLVSTYGNRQTPYNLLLYYEFYTALPKELQHKADGMPRQAIYTLASRNVPVEEKEEVVRDYSGESKEDLLALIRERFPLSKVDRRNTNKDLPKYTIQTIEKLLSVITPKSFKPTAEQKEQIIDLIKSLQETIA